MGLPTVKIPSEQVVLSDGQTIEVRGLSYAEHLAIGEIEGKGSEVMIACIAYATDSTPDEVQEWFASTPHVDVEAVSLAVVRVSKMDRAEGELSRAPSSAKRRTPSRSS